MRRVMIAKVGGGERPLELPTIKDRVRFDERRLETGLRLGASLRLYSMFSWLIDGALLARTQGGEILTMALPAVGKHRLVATDMNGRFAAIGFLVIL